MCYWKYSNVYAELQIIFFSWKDIHCISYQDTILVEQKKILVVHVHHEKKVEVYMYIG